MRGLPRAHSPVPHPMLLQQAADASALRPVPRASVAHRAGRRRVQEKLAAVIKAEGESEAAKLISDATKAYGAGMIELRRVEAAKEIAATLAKGRNVVYLPNSGNLLLNVQP